VTGCIEHAFNAVIAAEDAQRKLKKSRKKRPYNNTYEQWLAALVTEGVLTDKERDLLIASEKATDVVIQVDDFPNDFLQGAK